jgi:NAD(P)H-flavin reductase/DMSO/TMAO reductase YedYZ heme-binding membrane subunit
VKKVAARRVAYDKVPTSPAIARKGSRGPSEESTGSLAARQRRLQWWLADDVCVAGCSLGQRDQIIYGLLWTAWLCFLSFNETGNDYSHLTKRFGAIGASQIPMQYLLSLRRLNPVALAFGTSHERVNRWHRVLGYISYLFITLHGIFYLNYYVQLGDLTNAFFRSTPFLGMAGLLLMTLLCVTAFPAVRRWSYRVFYLTHLAVVMALPPMIWFHVHHSRAFMIEAGVLFVADRVARRVMRLKTSAKVEIVHNTDLIKVVATVPPGKMSSFEARPAAHVYLSIPSLNGSSSSWPLVFTSNPFTVAQVDERTSEITLVARQMRGPSTSTLAKLASLDSPAQLTLNLDGPYGTAGHFPNLVGNRFDQILLVAGGVGATFIMPLYRHVLATNVLAQVQVVWAVRNLDETKWPLLPTGSSVDEDDKIHVYVTGGNAPRVSADLSDSEDVELRQLHKEDKPDVPVERQARPDLRAIVDDVCCRDAQDRVAIVVCGPTQMARDLRRAAGSWVRDGRDVWFYNESFSW